MDSEGTGYVFQAEFIDVLFRREQGYIMSETHLGEREFTECGQVIFLCLCVCVCAVCACVCVFYVFMFQDSLVLILIYTEQLLLDKHHLLLIHILHRTPCTCAYAS
jgi:hypothetical protein